MPSPHYFETVWIVDDSVTDAQRVATTLKDDFQVKTFHDGAAALEALASSPAPDLLLLDWLMPGMSGLEVCRYLRSSRSAVSQIPIILLTAQHGRDEIEEAFKCGANDYVVKPFVAAELKARVKTLTSSRRHLRRAQSLVSELQRSEERLMIATSSANAGIWEWDIQSGALTSTEIHRKLFELPATGPFAFRELLDRVLPDDREHFEKNLAAAIESKSDSSVEFRILKSDGSISWIAGHGRVVSDENDGNLRMVGIHLDVSAQKNIEVELNRAKEEAERANRMKSSFLANMSHEIRTPLGAMLGFAHLMRDPLVTEMELSEYLDVMIRNGEQLSVIINDILDLSKVEAGLLTYEVREFDANQMCSEVVSLFKARAREQQLTLEFEQDASTPLKVFSDPTRLRQILMNLVSNALKFTRAGGIVIRCYGTQVGSKNTFSIEVEDTGIGIPDEQAERIFEMFVQGDDSTTRKFGGTGIGLALSRQLARNLGGDLELVSTDASRGSTFRVSVQNQIAPAVDKTRNEDVVLAQRKTNASITGIHVLIVDDSPDNQHLLSRYLTKRGATVDLASNGIEGYQKAIQTSYDVVLMDLQMPQMDGYAATKKLRGEGYTRPIIALTAHAMSEISAKCIEAGCNGYLPKPINQAELIETIAAHASPRITLQA